MKGSAVEKRTANRWILIQNEPLDVGAAKDFARDPEAGAINIFVGTTRQWTEGRETVELEYHCYESMAVKEIERLVEKAERRWSLKKVVVHHRLGTVPVESASVVIAVSSAHRAESFEACRFLIDELKRHVPIWKREQLSDGRSEWIEGNVPPVPG